MSFHPLKTLMMMQVDQTQTPLILVAVAHLMKSCSLIVKTWYQVRRSLEVTMRQTQV